MARPIEYVKAEIVRVAAVLGMSPREQSFTRTKFLPETDVTKHDLESYKGFVRLKHDAANDKGLPSIEDLVEGRGVQLRVNYARKLERQLGDKEYLEDKLKYMIENVFDTHPIKLSPGKLPPAKKPTERMLTLLLSDLHFGVDVDPREVFSSQFNWQIASRRLAKLCHQAAEYKKQYRDTTSLTVVLNGDLIHGVVHLSEANLRPLTEQIYGATSILLKALDFLRNHFKSVKVLCLPGNHDRMTYRDKGRAVSQRWDSHSHAVFLGLKLAFRNDKGISFDIPMQGMGTYDSPGGHMVLASHGDTAPDVGNVGKSLNVKQVTSNIQRINASQAFPKHIDVVLFGHWHQPSLFMLADGVTCIVNGCLIGSDPFAQNGVGYFNSMPAQIMFESVPGYPVGDHRIVQLRDADTEAAYDKIIMTSVDASGLDFSF